MTGFDLLTNYLDDPKVLLRKAKASLKKVLTLESEDNRIRGCLTPKFEAMANKTLHEFFALTTANIHTKPQTDVQENGFELKLALINMVQASQFCEKTHKDASAHLQHFMEIYNTFTIKGVTRNAILLRLFSILTIEKGKIVVLR
jgi:hypothetical protein